MNIDNVFKVILFFLFIPISFVFFQFFLFLIDSHKQAKENENKETVHYNTLEEHIKMMKEED